MRLKRSLYMSLAVVAACGGNVRHTPDGSVTEIDSANADARVDAASLDGDGDGVPDSTDNCASVANADQADADGDGIGDACDPDDDNDTVPDTSDNCPLNANVLQSDLDGDGIGDVCDPDDDGDGVPDVTDNCPTVANPDQTDADMNGIGDACVGVLTPLTSGIVVGGHLFSVGAATAARYDGTVKTSVDLVVPALPSGSTVLSAYLYWGTIGGPTTDVMLNTNAVTATQIAAVGDTCWNMNGNYMYRADVTTLVTGAGTYTMTGFPSASGGAADGQGASLVVLYRDPVDAGQNFIAIDDGGVALAPGQTTTTFSGITIGEGHGSAEVTTIVGDGQPASDGVIIGATTLGGGDAYPGASGAMWDDRVDDATAIVQPGPLSLAVTVDASGDCLSPIVTALTIDNAPSTVVSRTSSHVHAPAAKPGTRATMVKTVRGTPAFRFRRGG